MNQNQQKSENALKEEKLLQLWNEQKVFEKTLSKESPKGEYVFFEGPPTANGLPGIHHVMARSFKDIIPRYKTMQGFSVRRKAGWDTHGLPVELGVEKALGLKSKKEIEQYGVAPFNQKCRESVWKYKDEWEKLTARMGFWIDINDPYVTYANNYIEALWGVVKKISDRELLYGDFKVVPWCARCGTVLSSHELNQPGAYRDVKDLSVYAKFKIIGTDNGYFLAWTTTPWTLPGNVGLAVGADIDYVEAKVGSEILVVAKDRLNVLGEGYEIIAEHKGSEMVGMKYEPLYPFMSELISGDQKEKMKNAYQVYVADFVTTTDGTGIVHTAVMYGQEDFELGTQVGLPKFHLVNEEGKFISGTGFLEGRFVKEKNEKGEESVAIDIIKDLAGKNFLFKKEKYEHSYPHCWRCETPLIYYARSSWYFNVSKLRQQLLDANKEINWEPDHIKEGRFGEWLDGIKDWAISRDRYWGTPIPVWQTPSAQRVVIGGLADLKKYTKKSGNTYFAMRHGHGEHMVHKIAAGLEGDKYHLTEEGKENAHQAALQLKKKGITKIITSPLLRCRETAELVAEILGFSKDDITVDNRIREYDFGELNGIDWEKYVAHRDAHLKDYAQSFGGSSMLETKKRIGEFMYDIESKYKDQNILIVTHGIFFETVQSVLVGADNKQSLEILFNFFKHHRVQPGEIRELDFVALPHNENYELDLHKPYIDNLELELDGEKLTRTPEVMDVWFDSGCMPYAQDHKLGEEINFNPKPADFIAEGVDQTRGWFYTMHAVGNLLHDVPTINYKNVICLGLLLDAKGVKMSKSKGNIVEPWEMFDKYGADVVRFWFYSVNQPGESKLFDEKGLDEVNKKVFNLLRNVVSFYEMYQDDVKDTDPYTSTNVLDQWVLTLWNQTLETVIHGLEVYKIMEPARAIRDFVGELSTWYIRRSRDRFKSEDGEDRKYAMATTRYILIELTKVLAPFTPFIAEEIWQKLNPSHSSVHLESFPKVIAGDKGVLENMKMVRDMVTLGLEARSKANIKVRQPLAKLTVPKVELSEEYLEIIKDELNVKEIVMGDTLILDTEITQELKDEGDMRELVRKIQDMRKTAGFEPKDRVTVSLTESEPAWFSKFQNELLGSVGAEKIEWSAGEDRVIK